MGEGGVHESADSCRMGKVENVETVKLVCVGRLLRMGCDLFLMSVRWGNSLGAEWATMGTFCREPVGGKRG